MTAISVNVLTRCHMLQIVLLTEEHKLPSRGILSDNAGDGSPRKVPHILQYGCIGLLDDLGSLEDILCCQHNELKAVTLVLDLHVKPDMVECPCHERSIIYTMQMKVCLSTDHVRLSKGHA